MPSTKHKTTFRSLRAKPTDKAEEIELASVYLELNTRVQPTWGQ
jgi:hypothetical protein